MTTLEDRPYQAEAEAGIRAALLGQERGTGSGRKNRAAVLMATGGGKTVVMTRVVTKLETFGIHPRARTVIGVHRDELAAQTVRALLKADPMMNVGRVQGQAHNDVDAHVVVASVPTLANPRRREAIRDVGLFIADECHHAAAPSWVAALEHYGAWAGLPTVGFTATMTRTDAGKTATRLGDVWQEIVYEWTIMDGIRQGFLVDVSGVRVKVRGLRLDQVKRSAGDLQAGQLGEQLHEAGAPEQVVEGWAKHRGDHHATICFTPTVPIAHEVAEAFRAEGVHADVVTGATPIGDEDTDPWDADTRAAIFRRSRHYAEQGIPHVLVNCMVLTEGFDAPWLSCCIIMRATQSAGLYVQMAGRVLRLWTNPLTGERKSGALLIDVGGASDRHRLASPSDLDVSIAEVQEGETLREAAERQEAAEAQPEVVERAEGEVIGRRFDPFKESDALWSQTSLGYWFIATKQWIRFLYPQANGLFTVGAVPNAHVHAPWHRGPGDMLLEAAMAHVEDISLRWAPDLARRDASWRTRCGEDPATDAQRHQARRLGLGLPPGVTRALAADLITRKIADMAIHGPRANWSRTA